MGYKMNEITDPSDHKKTPKHCVKASDYMMKYMDGTIIEAEIEWLRGHVDECESCREDFLAYDAIMEEFSETELIAAPDCFEESVLARIALIHDESPENVAFEVKRKSAMQSIDNIFCYVWGVFSIVFGTAFLIFLNREQIMDVMAESTAFGGYIQVIRPFAQVVTSFIENVGTTASLLITSASGFISAYSYAFVGFTAFLIIIQYILKVRAKGFDIAFASEKNDTEK